jgi:hypothetical protein
MPKHVEVIVISCNGSAFRWYINRKYPFQMPVPVAARSKTQVYGRSPTATVDPNPTGGKDVCCQVEVSATS